MFVTLKKTSAIKKKMFVTKKKIVKIERKMFAIVVRTEETEEINNE